MEKQNRQSNFEILRILSMAMIIAFHSIYFSDLSFDSEISANKLLYDILYYLGELGVNCFILTSGYFLPTTTFKWKKLVLLILQVYFYFYGCRIATIMFTKAPIDAYDISSWFFPILQGKWWFVSAYILVYMLNPFLQKLISAINKKDFEILIFSQLLIWSIFPTLFLTSIGRTTGSMIFYNRYIWMIFLYIVGAYIKLYGFPAFNSTKRSLTVFATTTGVLFLYIFAIEFLFRDTKLAIQFWDTNSLFQVILSISLFYFFKNLKVNHSKTINLIASSVFGIYLLHEGPFRHNIWHKVFVFEGHETEPFLFARILFAVIVLMLAGIVVELCRKPFEKYISKILDRIEARYFTPSKP